MGIRFRALLALGASTALVAAPAAVADAAVLTVRSGMAVSIDDSLVTANSCTLGAVISRTKALTAGHCGDVGRPVYDQKGHRIGTITANRIARQLDIAVIRLAPRVSARIDTVDWDAKFHRGQLVWKSGITTGYGTGKVTDPAEVLRTSHGVSLTPPFLTSHDSYSIQTSLRSESGDSGAGVRNSRGQVVGILSSATIEGTVVVPVSRLPRALR
ncbi:trypsin-like serine protease [Gordonia amicalis]|uniref:trypsin-like serine protease n=1 Tax=Gordonia amicalis TaxID=89053 RepID=UPI00034874C2|nr:trypsin-like serine protease [Gordonia amicalis]MBA5846503.1 trypsin-like peptidase domain-containing protein [Gordonia amicalis]NKX76043.1 S1 family peptidase [Gordonia amicalis]UOG20081.1 S1 family peptidase [Gordonia amicalis]